MTRLRRFKITDLHLLIAALVALVALVVLMPTSEPDESWRRLSIRNSSSGGASVLRMWMEQLGYDVRELTTVDRLSGDVDAMFMLNPAQPYSPDEAEALYDWVAAGHMLLVVGTEDDAVNSVLMPFDVSLTSIEWFDSTLSLASPTLTTPPFDHVAVGYASTIKSARTDLVVHIMAEGQPVLASLGVGGGIVWISGISTPFTNSGLRDESSARLVANLLLRLPDDATVAFDESDIDSDTESGVESEREVAAPRSLEHWMISSPGGWSILLAGALVMGYLLLRGRRFGRIVPVEGQQLRREPTEYVRAIANLMRRTRQRDVALRHYRGELRRALAKRYVIDPGLSDAAFVRVLADRDPTLDVGALADLLRRLSARNASEHDLVSLAMAVDDWIGEGR